MFRAKVRRKLAACEDLSGFRRSRRTVFVLEGRLAASRHAWRFTRLLHCRASRANRHDVERETPVRPGDRAAVGSAIAQRGGQERRTG
jgi:hypothetical protein